MGATFESDWECTRLKEEIERLQTELRIYKASAERDAEIIAELRTAAPESNTEELRRHPDAAPDAAAPSMEPVAYVRYTVGVMPHFVPFINGSVTFACSAIEALEYEPLYSADQLAAYKQDAERYRWLRHGDNDDLVIVRNIEDFLPRNDGLDAAIDAAMKEKK